MLSTVSARLDQVTESSGYCPSCHRSTATADKYGSDSGARACSLPTEASLKPLIDVLKTAGKSETRVGSDSKVLAMQKERPSFVYLTPT